MTSYDNLTVDPLLDTLTQTQYTLFAAALFVGCMIFDVQFGTKDAPAPQPAVVAAPKPAPVATHAPVLPVAAPGQLHACLRDTDADLLVRTQ